MVCNLKILSEIGYKNNKNLDHVYIYIYMEMVISQKNGGNEGENYFQKFIRDDLMKSFG